MMSMRQYRALMRDRPHKAGAFAVDFTVNAPDPSMRCGNCVHLFHSLIAKKSTCEIFRGRGSEHAVPSSGSCRFWTKDGIHFPRYLSGQTSEPPKGAETDAVE